MTQEGNIVPEPGSFRQLRLYVDEEFLADAMAARAIAEGATELLPDRTRSMEDPAALPARSD